MLNRANTWVFGFLIGGALTLCAQENRRLTDLSPSPFEAFTTRSTSKVVWSKMIGRLAAPEISVTVNALVASDSSDEKRVMRGIRLDLSRTGTKGGCDWKYDAWTIMCNRANTAVYVTEDQLEQVRNSLTKGAAEIRPCDFISQSSTGLIVCGYELRNATSGDLAELLTAAISELKTAPR